MEADDAEAVEGSGRAASKASRVPQYTATIVVDILHFIYGLGIGWATIALPALTAAPGDVNATAANATATVANATAADSDAAFTMDQGSWLASVIYIVAIPTMPCFSFVCERYGRKACGYAIGVPYLASALLQAASRSFGLIMAARVLFGLAAGGIFVLAPLYVSEIAEDVLRGRLGAFVTLLRNVGILFAYVLGALTSYKNFEYASIVPPALFLVSFYFLPEAPMYLLRHGKEIEAKKALQWLRGKRADVSEELQNIKDSLRVMDSAGASSATLRDLFATRGSRRAVGIGLLMSCNQQLCGFFGVVSYTFIIFEKAGAAVTDLSNVITGSMLVLGISVSMILYDRLPRKVLLLTSNALMIPSLITLSIYFYLEDHGHDVSSWWWLPVMALSIYVLGYSTGVAALPIVILTEIFSPKIRNLGLTTNGLFCWFAIFLLTKTFPSMKDEIGFYGTCWFYTFWCLLGVVVILTILPETKNRKLESILDELENGKKNSKKIPESADHYEIVTQDPIETIVLKEEK